MKQPKLWRRWFAKQTERIEITHETNTLIIMRASRGLTPVRCPECGSDLHSDAGAATEALICPAALLSRISEDRIGNIDEPQGGQDELRNL